MILFVGDRPSKRTDPNVPFKGAACEKRLTEWIEYIGAHPYYIINSHMDDSKDLIRLWQTLGFPIVALGNNASKALGNIYHFKLPHPSGRNRQINNKEFINKKLEECKNWLKSYNK